MENEKYEVSVPAIESDKLIEMANQAEKRIEAVLKIKKMALRLTNAHDWTDQGGKPYLQVSGAEKIARLFGISWRFMGDIQRKDEEDGHFSFEVTMEFIMSGASVEFRGSRSSKDPFFSKKYGTDIPPGEIDKTDVMKAAITNTIGNGITRMLGIRNLTWEDLKGSGVEIDKIGKIDYKKGGGNGKSTEKPQDPQASRPQMKDPSAPASEKQLGAIHAILGKLGIKDDYEKHEKVAEILNLPAVPETLSGLSMGDAGKVIDALGKEAPK